MSCQLTSILLLVILCQLCAMELADINYVTPARNTNCSEQQAPCFTLSQYAANSINYSALNTTLVLLPGNHSLQAVLWIRNSTHFSIIAHNSLSTVTIICSHSGRFKFESVEQVSLRNLVLLGCVNNTLSSVRNFSIENCTMNGQKNYGTGLNLNRVDAAKISKSSFVSFTSTKGSSTHITSSSVSINSTLFMGNKALVSGGGIFTVCANITIQNSCFTSNTVTGIAGKGGAINSDYSNITIQNSSFQRNDVNSTVCNDNVFGPFGQGGAICVSNSNFTLFNTTFTDNTAAMPGLGGAIAARTSFIDIELTIFFNNTSHYFAGAVFVLHSATFINNSLFIHNVAYVFAGAIYAANSELLTSGFLDILINTGPNSVVFALCSAEFTGNVTISNNNGGLYAYSSDIVINGIANITNNSNTLDNPVGRAITSLQSNITFAGTIRLMYNTARYIGGAILASETKLYTYGETTVAHNAAASSGGGIYAYQSELNFRGRTRISGNIATENGGGISAVGSTTNLFEGSLTLHGNSATRGGGIFITLNSKLYVKKVNLEYTLLNGSANFNSSRLKLNFTNNFAKYGGALYIDDANSGTCAPGQQEVSFRLNGSYQLYTVASAECFFQGLIKYDSFQMLLNDNGFSKKRISVRNTFFINNTATSAGGTLYGGLLDRCTLHRYSEVNFKYSYNITALRAFSYLTNIADLHSTDVICSDPVKVYLCRQDTTYHSLTMYVKKGESFIVSAVAVDQAGNAVPAIIRSFLSNSNSELARGQAHQNTFAACTHLEFNVYTSRESEKLFLYADGPCKDTEPSTASIDIRFEPCPMGFQDSPDGCVCNSCLYPSYTSNCNIDKSSVMRKDDAWIATDNTSGKVHYLTYTSCPFDYCHRNTEDVYVNLNIPNGADKQCAFNRSGILCGSCKNGLSLTLGSSHCALCSNNWVALFIFFAIAGVLLVVFILVFDLTVDFGSINGLILYANIIAANRATFLPFSTPNILTIFIAWLNLDFGFTTCLYNGLDGYAKIWLQFLFPVYILLLVALVILIAHYSPKFSKILYYRNPVATLATLILLSYAKLLRTIIAAMSFASLEYRDSIKCDSKIFVVWRIDANILYFQGKHIPLFFFALFVLSIGLTYSFVLLIWQWIQHCSNIRFCCWSKNVRFDSFVNAYLAPYNQQYRFWVGLLLLIRVLLYIIAASVDVRSTLLLVSCVMGGVLFFKEFLKDKVYKNRILNIIESSFIFNIVVFSIGTLYTRETKGNQTAIACISTSVAFLTFIGILIYHAFASFKQLKKLTSKINTTISTFLSKVKIKQSKLLPNVSFNKLQQLVEVEENEENEDFSQLREPLRILDEPTADDYRIIQQSLYKAPHFKGKSKGVTHTIVDAIPAQSEEVDITDSLQYTHL